MTTAEQLSGVYTAPSSIPPTPPAVPVGAAVSTPAASMMYGRLWGVWKHRLILLAIYMVLGLTLSPLTYRFWTAIFSTAKNISFDREYIVSGPAILSPIAYFTRLAETNTAHFIAIKEEDYVHTIPENFGNVTSLEHIHISNNPIRRLPDSIGNLTHLQSLQIQNTRLETLPATIANITGLTDLSLQGNRITRLPDAFGTLQSLVTINLAYNNLTELPPSVGTLTNTILLDLTGNKFTSVPRYLPPNLEVLFLGGNPIPIEELEALQLRNRFSELIIYY